MLTAQDKYILVHMIPDFDSKGNLPAGGPYEVSWQQFELHFGYNDKRKKLLQGLRDALEHLKEAGCRRVFIDGSFITFRKHPADWDACWLIDNVDFEKLDPLIIDESFHHEKRKRRYLGDLFLHSPRLPGGNWVRRFQIDKNGNKKGILVIDLENFS